jgi:predicted unusual protein kinase regulating ubiquinone biosynthesis (AarF/ABC1/UbiB family)
MDELLDEYIQYEKEQNIDETANSVQGDAAAAADQQGYDDYVKRTEEYYYKMSCRDLFRALWFTMSSCYIGITELIKYKVGWKSRNHAIMDVSRRLAAKNMMYVKVFQAFATNRNIVSPELNEFFSEYTDNVKYTADEYDIKELKELEARSRECWPYQQLRIENEYTPIKSGLMSLIFKGYIGDGGDGGAPIVIKYLRKNISKNFNSSMNNLVVFAKITKYFPYLRTLNVENLVLQNIVSMNDQVCFRKELANIKTYYNSWKDYPYVKIPMPYSDYTENVNPDVVVMEYIDGIKITEIEPEDNNEFGKVLASFNGKAAFCTSIYHGDLHPGNILFIKTPSSSTSAPTHKIGILDFGIIGHLSRTDQEILFNATKFMYQRKFNKIIDLIMSCKLSECMNAASGMSSSLATTTVPARNSDTYNTLREELTRVLVEYTTPEIKFFGVSEIYEINYILNKYGMMFKRSLYRLFITVAIMDSIGNRLGGEMSYMQHMTDIVVEMFNIKIDEPDTESEADADTDAESEADTDEEEDEESEPEADTD